MLKNVIRLSHSDLELYTFSVKSGLANRGRDKIPVLFVDRFTAIVERYFLALLRGGILYFRDLKTSFI